MHPTTRRLASVMAAAVALACATSAARAADLTVSAAASLTNAFKDMAPAFEAQNPGDKVLLNFAASGALLQQMAKGAPVDVFASADLETMDQAEKQALVKPGARSNFARNSLVVIVPVNSVVPTPQTLNDLTGEKFVHIAIGTPASVPVGRYTQSVLEHANLWKPVEAKAINAASVRQALDYVARGEAEAGFVYATDAAVMPDKVKVAFNVPTERPVLYPIAPLAASANAALAARFIAFVESPAGQAILAKYGFGRP